MELPKEKPSLEESYLNTASQFGHVMDLIESFFEDSEAYRSKKMKRGNDRELGLASSFSLLILKLLTDSLRKNWNLTFILRDVAFDQNELLIKMVNKMESQAVSNDDKKEIANLKHSVMENLKQFESIRVEFDVTKHKADNAQQIANDVRRKTTKFDKLEPLFERIEELLQEKGGYIE